MKYLVLLIGDGEESPWESLSPEEQGSVMQKFEAFGAACEARDGVAILSGEALAGPDTFTTLRPKSGRLQATEGPYAEAIEGLGGYYLVESPDLDTLIELLHELPSYDMQVIPAVDVP